MCFGGLCLAQQPVSYLKSVQPSYPTGAAKESITGTVVIGLEIAESGQLERAWVEKSCGDQALDDAALAAAQKSQYLAARDKNGSAIKAVVFAPYIFKTAEGYVYDPKIVGIDVAHYEYNMQEYIGKIYCADAVADARRFIKANPNASFSEMRLYKETVYFLGKSSEAQKPLSPNIYTSAILHCTKNEFNIYIDAIRDLLDSKAESK